MPWQCIDFTAVRLGYIPRNLSSYYLFSSDTNLDISVGFYGFEAQLLSVYVCKRIFVMLLSMISEVLNES